MSFNTRSPAVKRLLKEAQELQTPTELFHAQPLEDNIFEWHFTIRGPSGSDFDGGIYHGRIILPAEYPMKPPSIIMLTPSGRFKVNEKLCLSISGHHPETWLPSWSIRTALLAIIGFMPTMGEGAIGSLDYTSEERKLLAKKSVNFVCPTCKSQNSTALPNLTDKSDKESQEARELGSQIQFKDKKEDDLKKESEPITSTTSNSADAESPTGLSNQINVTSTPILTRRVVSSSSSDTNLNENESNSINQQASSLQNRASASSTSNLQRQAPHQQEESNLYKSIIILLSLVILFLVIRRIFMIFDSFFSLS